MATTTFDAWPHGTFDIDMPGDAVLDCSHAGRCDEDVAHWLPRLDLDHITPAQARAALAEYGAWDDDQLASHEDNLERLVWIAAGDIQEKRARA